MNRCIVAAMLCAAGIAATSPSEAASDGFIVLKERPSQSEVAAERAVRERPGIAVSTQALALTLPDCYALALRQSEVVAINRDLIDEADARLLQALSIMTPHVSFISSDTQIDNSAIKAGGTSGLSSLKPVKTSERKFNAKQTLFSGFRAIAGIRGSRLERSQRIDETIRAEQILLVDVANAFYLLMEKQEDLKAYQRIRRALIDRVKELRGREALGRSRLSEVVNAKAQLYGVEAAIELIRSQEIVARQQLEFLVGRPVAEIVDSYPIPASLETKECYASRSKKRPDVRAAEFAWKAARQERDIANSGFLPTVDFEGNYYVQRTGFNKGTDWDILLKVAVPIFEGTEVLGKSKQAASKVHEREMELRRVRRKAVTDIKDAYVNLVVARTVQDALRKEYATAKLNYFLQRKDYARSLVSNLDVLAAIQTLQNAQRDYIQALYAAKRLYWQLRVATGEGLTENVDDLV